jgi:hypothetical protein
VQPQRPSRYCGVNAHFFPPLFFITAAVKFAMMSSACQSAFKFDPRSASNFDPLWRRVLIGGKPSGTFAVTAGLSSRECGLGIAMQTASRGASG